MSDAEMTKLCAIAIGLVPSKKARASGIYCRKGSYLTIYDPLRSDAQAMALVKRFNLWISSFPDEEGWRVHQSDLSENEAIGKDLNHAIVECVSKMQQSAVNV